jgi:hypothetical protein
VVSVKRRFKYSILLVVLVMLWNILSCPLRSYFLDRTYNKPPHENQSFTMQELENFLGIWLEVRQSRMYGLVKTISLETAYPAPLIRWLDLHEWNIERFFYDAQRLQQLTYCASIRENLRGNLKLSRKYSTNLRSIINKQKEQLDSCSFNDLELDLIAANLYQINDIFTDQTAEKTSAE